ncbi:MAG: excinuclease ABC subunit UvrA [Vicinamibacteraceae bacterium]|nr:excinuclease ABC subunit UvrA [Vicinamibacteraceae bacterium]
MHETTSPAIRDIVVRGARTHNLKNIDVTLPAGKLIVVTGVSGSGKSSLAFDTIYAEGQRRYVESLSAYARQFLERMEKPDVDSIEGISPAIAIRQKNTIRNPRSTVGTTTEIHDYLRLLFARVGRTVCRQCGRDVIRETAEIVATRLQALPEGTRVMVGFAMPMVTAAAYDAIEHTVETGEDEGGETDRAVASSSGGGTRRNGNGRGRAATNGHGGSGEVGADAPHDPVTATLDALRRKGFGRVLVDGRAVGFDAVDVATLAGRDEIEVIVDRVQVEADSLARLTDAVEIAYQEGGGSAFALVFPREGDGTPRREVFSERFECRACGIPYEIPQPRLFSFNNPFGACPTCHGFGNVIELDLDLVVPDPTKTIAQGAIEPWTKPHYRSALTELKRAARARKVRLDVPWVDLSEDERRFVIDGDGHYEGVRGFFAWLERKKYKVHVRVFLSRYRGYQPCPACGGARLRREARDVQVGGRTIDAICAMTVEEARAFFDALALSEREAAIADKVLGEIRRRLGFLHDVGLDYLTLDRLSSTLSGGESQRINLATSLGSALVGTLYVLDEPSIGLHPRDNRRLIDILRQLRDQGNTVLVVEHDADMIAVADHLLDLGVGAGEQGGRLVYAGDIEGLLGEPRSLTAKYMRDELAIPVPSTRRKALPQKIRVVGASEHNLKGIDVEIPLGTLTVITGVSGSGKSTLVHEVLYAGLKRAKGQTEHRLGAVRRIEGADLITDVVLVDQTPIGRTPRSNPVTYLKAFDPIRELFAATKDARAQALTASHFSFNVPGGRCDACEGEGQVRVEMQFLADVFVPCDECHGKRFKPQVLDVRFKGRNIDEVLDMTVREALTFFSGAPKVLRRLQVLDEIGLGYLRLGQSATTLSGGEAQRIKIAAHLSSRGGDRVLYILDEPTTGLHFDDIAKLLAAFRKLLQAGHSLLVIEHNLDVIKTADWIIDLGPEGGAAGGRVVVAGTPEQVAAHEGSHTGRYLAAALAGSRSHAYAGSR